MLPDVNYSPTPRSQPSPGARPKEPKPVPWQDRNVYETPGTCRSNTASQLPQQPPVQIHKREDITKASEKTATIEGSSLPKQQVQVLLLYTEANQDYIYHGSMTLYLQGVKIRPSDIDIMCTSDSADRLIKKLNAHPGIVMAGHKSTKDSSKINNGILELNIPNNISFGLRNTGSPIEQLKVQLNVLDQFTFTDTKRTTTKISGYNKEYEIHTEPLTQHLEKLILNNKNYCGIYLLNNHFKNLPTPIRRSILFNGQTTDEAKEYTLLMRALLSTMKSNKSVTIFSDQIKINTKDIKVLIKTLKESTSELLEKIGSYSCFDEFSKEVNRRLKDNPKNSEFVNTLMNQIENRQSNQGTVTPEFIPGSKNRDQVLLATGEA